MSWEVSNKGQKAVMAALNPLCFAAPFLTGVLWTDAHPFTGNIGWDRAIAVVLVVFTTQGGAYWVRRALNIKD